MKRSEAYVHLAQAFPPPTITLQHEDMTFQIPGRALGISYDIDAALTAAYMKKTVAAVPLRIDHAVLNARLRQFAVEAHIAPVDAAITVDRTRAELFSYYTDSNGMAVDVISLARAISTAVQQGEFVVRIPVTAIEAEVTLEDLRHQTQKLASFTTSFAASPLNKQGRVFNIKKAAAAIHGTVLLPDEEFDCNAVLGDRNAENGWQEAAAIRGGMYTTEYGGGVCQVSSTLFNAVMMADLHITERYPHSWPMRYVPIGRDATISTGGKNFRFVNDQATPVTIGMTVDSNAMTLTCTIYGTPLPEGQYIRIRSEQTATLDSLPEERILDESLPLATKVLEREARRGKTSVTYKEYYAKDGTHLKTKVAHEDVYRSIAARVLLSTDLYYSRQYPDLQ